MTYGSATWYARIAVCIGQTTLTLASLSLSANYSMRKHEARAASDDKHDMTIVDNYIHNRNALWRTSICIVARARCH